MEGKHGVRPLLCHTDQLLDMERKDLPADALAFFVSQLQAGSRAERTAAKIDF